MVKISSLFISLFCTSLMAQENCFDLFQPKAQVFNLTQARATKLKPVQSTAEQNIRRALDQQEQAERNRIVAARAKKAAIESARPQESNVASIEVRPRSRDQAQVRVTPVGTDSLIPINRYREWREREDRKQKMQEAKSRPQKQEKEPDPFLEIRQEILEITPEILLYRSILPSSGLKPASEDRKAVIQEYSRSMRDSDVEAFFDYLEAPIWRSNAKHDVNPNSVFYPGPNGTGKFRSAFEFQANLYEVFEILRLYDLIHLSTHRVRFVVRALEIYPQMHASFEGKNFYDLVLKQFQVNPDENHPFRFALFTDLINKSTMPVFIMKSALILEIVRDHLLRIDSANAEALELHKLRLTLYKILLSRLSYHVKMKLQDSYSHRAIHEISFLIQEIYGKSATNELQIRAILNLTSNIDQYPTNTLVDASHIETFFALWKMRNIEIPREIGLSGY